MILSSQMEISGSASSPFSQSIDIAQTAKRPMVKAAGVGITDRRKVLAHLGNNEPATRQILRCILNLFYVAVTPNSLLHLHQAERSHD